MNVSELLEKYIITVILLNLAFTLVNVTGIFDFNTNIMGIDYDKVSEQIEDLKDRFGEASSGMDYLVASAFALLTGLQIILMFAFSIIFGFGGILETFMIPPEIAQPIGLAVGSILLLGIGYLFIRRG